MCGSVMSRVDVTIPIMLGVLSTINVVRQMLIALDHQTPTAMAFLQTDEGAVSSEIKWITFQQA
jgi:hypothetical protein